MQQMNTISNNTKNIKAQWINIAILKILNY